MLQKNCKKMINTKNISTKIFFEEAKREIIISNERKDLLTDIAQYYY